MAWRERREAKEKTDHGPGFPGLLVELQNDVNLVPAICCTLALISLRTEASTIARLIFKMEM